MKTSCADVFPVTDGDHQSYRYLNKIKYVIELLPSISLCCAVYWLLFKTWSLHKIAGYKTRTDRRISLRI